MKKLIFIILTLFSLHSFAQDTTYVKVRGIPGAYNFSKSGDSLIFYVAGVRHALYIGATAGTGSVTSVAKGYGILQDGTITTTGTITVDSAALASKFKRITDSTDVSMLNGGKIDTSHLPVSNIYIQQAGAGETQIVRAGNDTTLLVATLKNSTDITISKNADSSVSAHLKATGVTAGSYTNVNATVDTSGRIIAISNGSSGTGSVVSVTGNPTGLVDNTDPANPVVQQDASKLPISDTAAMLSPYLLKNDVSGGTINQILKKNSSTDYDWSWQDESGGGSVTFHDSTLTATASQTDFTYSFAPKLVYRNGVLIDAALYSIAGNTVTFTFGLDADDKVRVTAIQ